MGEQSGTYSGPEDISGAANTVLKQTIQVVQGITRMPRKLTSSFPNLFESNFTHIAKNTTKYYLELNNSYISRFKDEASRLATAGILAAQNYIFIKNPKISHQELIHLAHDIVSRGQLFRQEILISYVISLEIELLRIDKPNLSDSDIVMACSKKERKTTGCIQKLMETYVSEPAFAFATTEFMESSRFERFRKELGISD